MRGWRLEKRADKFEKVSRGGFRFCHSLAIQVQLLMMACQLIGVQVQLVKMQRSTSPVSSHQ